MNKFFAAGLIVLDILLFSSLPLTAQSIDAETEKCENAIASVESQLQAGRQLTIELSEIRNVTYSDYPEGRANQYTLAMDGNAVESVLNSSVLMNTLATGIIDRCNSVSLVSFGLYGSGYIVKYGLMNNGEVKIFQCPEDYDPPYYRDLVWGESCSI